MGEVRTSHDSCERSLKEKLDKIRSPKLQSQQSTQIVLSAIEDTLRDQKTEASPAGYFAALLSLLPQAISTTDVNRDLATSVVYLLDVITPYTPQPLLRSKFSQILTNIAPALTSPEANSPLLRPSIGCLESLLLAQDSAAWDMGRTQIGPRQALSGLLILALDHRPKVRKRALEATFNILTNPPPSVAVDHPAADMCAETALRKLDDLVSNDFMGRKEHKDSTAKHEPSLIHALSLIKTVASASGGWPARKIESLCEFLLNISKSSNQYLKVAAFEVFEIIIKGMASAETSSKLPRLLEIISELQPSQNDAQLLPPWIAIISRGYVVLAKIQPDETFQKLPEIFTFISGFLSSSSLIIRTSASECLISLMENCVPKSVLLESSIHNQNIIETLGKAAVELLSVKYQAAWLQTFDIIGSMLDSLRWKAESTMIDAIRVIGELREASSFDGKEMADKVIGKAIRAVGPEILMDILPLNITNPGTGEPGRAWLLQILRDNVRNTNLKHFKNVFIPLSETIFQRVIDHNTAQKTMEIKIFETLVQQIWALLPGYCDLPLDLTESFDQEFAELVSNLLYRQTDLRHHICKALQTLVDSNRAISLIEGEDNLLLQNRITKTAAQNNLNYLSTFSSNMLAVLFNVYSQTLPQFRWYILQCINAYLSITPAKDVRETFERVYTMLETCIKETGAKTQSEKLNQKQKNMPETMPPTSHTLMDLVVAISIYLPQESFHTLFKLASLVIHANDDPQLQKKAYKIIPRLSTSNIGQLALKERSHELQQLLISSSDKVCSASKKDRLAAMSALIPSLPNDSLHFIPTVLSEVVISCKETNEKARTTAFDLLVLMGEKISNSPDTLIENNKIPHMPDDAPSASASLEEYFTMVSAGLAGSTPHMQSACVTALTRILFHFHEKLKPETISELVETMDIYLASNNREIVRSVLGFIKVCVISLPLNLMQSRLPSLIPNLMIWSREHKGHFKAKVKHIIERMMRRFGVELLNKYCPENDRKLISNIRKTKERNKRHKAAEATDDKIDKNESGARPKKQGHFESEYDAAVYESDSSSSGSDVSENEVLGRKSRGNKKISKTYIVEDEEEPLDLLDRRALANISSTKPEKLKSRVKAKVKTDMDGKILLDDTSDNDISLDVPSEAGDNDCGIDAYVRAIKGQDSARRGRGGRLKFSNKRDKSEGNEMEIDQDEVRTLKSHINGSARGGLKIRNNSHKSSRIEGNSLSVRRGLENNRRGNSRVTKSSRGRRSLR